MIRFQRGLHSEKDILTHPRWALFKKSNLYWWRVNPTLARPAGHERRAKQQVLVLVIVVGREEPRHIAEKSAVEFRGRGRVVRTDLLLGFGNPDVHANENQHRSRGRTNENSTDPHPRSVNQSKRDVCSQTRILSWWHTTLAVDDDVSLVFVLPLFFSRSEREDTRHRLSVRGSTRTAAWFRSDRRSVQCTSVYFLRPTIRANHSVRDVFFIFPFEITATTVARVRIPFGNCGPYGTYYLDEIQIYI